MKFIKVLFLITGTCSLPIGALGQTPAARPVPYPVFETPQFERAIEAGTRSRDGNPGPNYWTNRAVYDIDVTLSPVSRRLAGTSTVIYQNNSPDVPGTGVRRGRIRKDPALRRMSPVIYAEAARSSF